MTEIERPRTYADFPDQDGKPVIVRQSRAPGEPKVWVFTDRGGDNNGASHLTATEARRVRDALDAWLSDQAGDPVATCRVCGCTEDAPCEGGCHWAPDPEQMGDLCSACVDAALLVTVVDLKAGETETRVLAPGGYWIITAEPCYVAHAATDVLTGTHTLTVKDQKEDHGR